MNIRGKVKVGVLFVCLVCAAAANAATVAYYRFEDSPGFTNDSSSFGNLGNSNGTHYTLPVSGQGANFGVPQGSGSNMKALDLDNAGDLLDTGNTGSNLFTGDTFTVEAMFNRETGRTIVGQWHNAINRRVFQFAVEANNKLALHLSSSGGNNTIFDSGLGVSPNEDYFAAVTYDAGTIIFYLKQNPDVDGPTRTNVVIAAPPYDEVHQHDRLTVGGVVGGGNGFLGVVDEVRISDVALGSADLLVPVSNDLPPTVAYWRFEDSPGFTNDSSDSGLDLVNSGVTQYALPGSGAGSAFPDPVPKTGIGTDEAAQFNQSSDILETGNSGISPLFEDYTVEAFINNDVVQNFRNVIAGQWDHNANNRSWMFMIDPSNKLGMLLSGNGTSFDTIVSALTIDNDKDYYVAVSFDLHGDLTFYAQNLTDEGALQVDAQSHPLTELFIDDRFSIGQTFGSTGNDFVGVIDELRISREVLPVHDLLITKIGLGTFLNFE